MKKIIAYVLSFLLLMTMSGSSFVFADSGYDNTAPVIKSLAIKNSDKIGQSEYMTAAIDLIEDGVGVKSIMLDFYNKQDGHQPFVLYQCDEPGAPDQELLFTGNHKIRFYIGDRFYKAKYDLKAITIEDQNGNRTVYDRGEEPSDLIWKSVTPNITVIKAGMTDRTAPVISNFKINNAKNIDASKSLSASFDLTEDGSGCRTLDLVVRNAQGHEKTLRWNADREALFTGKHTIAFPINGVLAHGEYQLRQLYATDLCNNYNLYEEFNQSITVTSSKLTDVTAPVIKKANLEVSNLKTPGVLPVKIELLEDGTGLLDATIELTNTKTGRTKQLAWSRNDYESSKGLAYKTGVYTLFFPVSPFWGQGEYELNWIHVRDKAGNDEYYHADELFAGENANDTVAVSSSFDIAYYGSLGNAKAIDGVKSLKEGETAVLDCRMASKAKKELFIAIAGKNRTIVFEDENVQWVFNGKDIAKSKCKDISVSSKIQTVSGASQGYPDEAKIVKIIFPNNGALPGKADIRANDAYITQKYVKSDKSLILSYLEKGSPKVEATGVECADDHYAEFDVKHNSTFILSETKARLIAPASLKVSSNGVSSANLSWSKVPGARGYLIYRSASKTGSYKVVGKVTDNKKQSWKDTKLKPNKQYYYKVKAYGSDKATRAQFSSTMSMRTAPPKQSVTLKTSKRAIKVNWKSDYMRASGYQIIYANNSKFKSKTTIKVRNRYTNKYTIKRAKPGKTYYVKVRSYKTSSGKTVYGAYSNMKKIKAR